MSALGFLAASSMLAGGLPAFPRGRRRRVRHPDPVVEAKAAAKRARKAAKREEDARRSAEGPYWLKLRHDHGRGLWDWLEQDYRLWGPSFVGGQTAPRWRQRLNHRRSLPWVGRTCVGSYAWKANHIMSRAAMLAAWTQGGSRGAW